jgi:hypothetical protein
MSVDNNRMGSAEALITDYFPGALSDCGRLLVASEILAQYWDTGAIPFGDNAALEELVASAMRLAGLLSRNMPKGY